MNPRLPRRVVLTPQGTYLAALLRTRRAMVAQGFAVAPHHDADSLARAIVAALNGPARQKKAA